MTIKCKKKKRAERRLDVEKERFIGKKERIEKKKL